MQMLFSFFYFMLYFAGIMQAEVFFCFNEIFFLKTYDIHIIVYIFFPALVVMQYWSHIRQQCCTPNSSSQVICFLCV